MNVNKNLSFSCCTASHTKGTNQLSSITAAELKQRHTTLKHKDHSTRGKKVSLFKLHERILTCLEGISMYHDLRLTALKIFNYLILLPGK